MDQLFGDKLEQLLSNEQTMGKILEIASSLSGGSADAPPPKCDPPPDCPPKRDACPPPPPPPSKVGGYCAILAAIKPYLDHERRERADKMIRALRIAETAKKIIGI